MSVANIGIILGGTSFSCIYTLIYSSLCGGIKKNVMGGCITHKEKGRVLERFWWGNLRKRDHLKDLGLDECMICK